MDYCGTMASRDFSTYLTWSAEDERWQLVCVDVGAAEVQPRSPYPPSSGVHPAAHRTVATGRTVNEYQLVYVTRGRGELRVDGLDDVLTIEEGAVLLVLPGVRHSYRPDPATGWSERWVGFKGAWADSLRAAGLLSAQRPLFRTGLDERLLGLFEELFGVVADQEPYYQMRAGSLVMRLLAEILARSRRAEQRDDAGRLVERAKFLMAEKVYGVLSVDGIGEDLGVPQTKFYDAFKAYTGLTPYQYFIQLKVNRAKELLSLGACSVKEAAFKLGFDDPYYFSRLFKKKTGTSPSDWASKRGRSGV
jgi:AraC-like DNA-binding protein